MKLLAVGALLGLASTLSAQANGDGLTTAAVTKAPVAKPTKATKVQCVTPDCKCEQVFPPRNAQDWLYWQSECVQHTGSKDRDDDKAFERKHKDKKHYKKRGKHHKKHYKKRGKHHKKHYKKSGKHHKKHYKKRRDDGKKHYKKGRDRGKKHYKKGRSHDKKGRKRNRRGK